MGKDEKGGKSKVHRGRCTGGKQEGWLVMVTLRGRGVSVIMFMRSLGMARFDGSWTSNAVGRDFLQALTVSASRDHRSVVTFAFSHKAKTGRTSHPKSHMITSHGSNEIFQFLGVGGQLSTYASTASFLRLSRANGCC